MQIDFENIIDRRKTDSIKWDLNLKIFGREDILPMWVADMDFPSPPAVAEAIRKRTDHAIFGYTGVPASYYYAVMDWMKKRNNWDIQKDWMVHSPGVVTSIITCILAFTSPGDKVLIQSPVYPPFYSSILNNSRQLVINPLKLTAGYYGMDFDDLETRLRDGVKMMILCSPHNPVGRVWTAEELLRVTEICSKYGVLIISDEIHSDLIYKRYKHIPIASLPGTASDNIITCISPTKTFNMAGLASSFTFIPDRKMKKLFEKELERTGAGMNNIFGMIGGEAAFRYGEEWLEDLLAYLQGNLDLVLQFFEERVRSIRVIKPEGTYLVWLDCRELGMDVSALREFFIHQAGVGLNEGTTFGVDGAGFMRMNFACPRPVLLEGLKRIENAILP